MFQKLSLYKTAGLIAVTMWACLFLHNFAYAAPDGVDLQEHEFEALAGECAADIHIETLKAVVRTESGYNPFAIGVVGGSLSRQPRSLQEALKAVEELEEKGFNYSVGLSQVNKSNFKAFGESAENLFEPCRNLQVGSSILKGCYESALSQNESPQEALALALSCYYSGNFERGFKVEDSGVSYVQLVRGNVNKDAKKVPIVPALEPVAGGDDTISHQSQEAAIKLAPASAPAKLRKENQTPDWVIIPEPAAVNQPETGQPVKVQVTQTATPNPTKGDAPGEVRRETDFVTNNRLKPGDFVLILN